MALCTSCLPCAFCRSHSSRSSVQYPVGKEGSILFSPIAPRSIITAIIKTGLDASMLLLPFLLVRKRPYVEKKAAQIHQLVLPKDSRSFHNSFDLSHGMEHLHTE